MSQVIDTKLPALTREEWTFFTWYNEDFFVRYNLLMVIPLYKKVASALHTLAMNKLLGIKGFKKNRDEAVQHHIKACEYDPHKACTAPSFREETGLRMIEHCKICNN